MSITTARALDALPEGTMIRDHMGDLHVSFLTYREKLPRWQEVGMDEWRDSEDMVREVGGRFIILYCPNPPGTKGSGWHLAKATSEIRGLRAERREIAAESWQQGYDAALSDGQRDATAEPRTENPYRVAARWTWDCGCETWDAEGSDDGVPWHGREYANTVHGIGIEKHHGREVTP